MYALDTLILTPLTVFYENVMRFLPTILTALLILIIGIILAVCFKMLFHRLFKIFKFDSAMERFGVSRLLSKGGLRGNPSTMLARLIGWFIFFVFCLGAINSLQITAVEKLVESFLLYLPHFFATLLILLVGYLLSNFFYRTVLIAAVNAGNRFAGMVARFVKYAIIILVLTMALEQLGIGKGTVVIAFALIFGGVVFAFAIAFGLGGKSLAERYLEKHFKEINGSKKDNGEEDKINHL